MSTNSPHIPDSEPDLLHCQNLIKRYRRRVVVSEVSLRVRQGEIVGLLGPNGAGKTTTFYMFVGLIQPNKGAIFYNDNNITNLPMYKRARMGIGYLSQEASIFRNLTVRENLESILQFKGLNRKEIRQRTDQLIEEFNLQRFVKNKGFNLSGGERRRVEV
ncbi:MAG TPA: ATP-binding cassette domain-containing protein, partial [Balneolales bacterium]|nr:ATP-binding cassette domain-containing protein [Balneolales bacterium]